MSTTNLLTITLSIANELDREMIYQIRYEIYANELNQHSNNHQQQLSDYLDKENFYIVAKDHEQIAGFISITTPRSTNYSVDKYFPRTAVPFSFDEHLYEIRLLSVIKQKRNAPIALALMYAAFRWVQSHGGKYIVAICREDLLEMYQKAGLKPLQEKVLSGKVNYVLSIATIDFLQSKVDGDKRLYTALQRKINWKLPFLFFAPSPCYHGGSFFEAIGEDLQSIEKAKDIINADVLDAWFAPSPKVIQAIQSNLPFLLQTSPPTHAEGLKKVIAETRGVQSTQILPGAGSSDLIFLALTRLLTRASKVLIIDPCYGEYIHVLEKVIQCEVNRFNLHSDEGFKINTHGLLNEINKGYDMVILVNPNSPTGIYCSKQEMEAMLLQIAPLTLVWIDETYIEYVGPNESLEQFACNTNHVIICKSMSKTYALSGVRAAYLCCAAPIIENIQQYAPPWAISLPAQAAAIAALQDPAYYQEKYSETNQLRQSLKEDLEKLGITQIIKGVANFILFYLPPNTLSTLELIEACKSKGLYLRDVSNMGKNIKQNAVRIAVKDRITNQRMLAIIKESIQKSPTLLSGASEI